MKLVSKHKQHNVWSPSSIWLICQYLLSNYDKKYQPSYLFILCCMFNMLLNNKQFTYFHIAVRDTYIFRQPHALLLISSWHIRNQLMSHIQIVLHSCLKSILFPCQRYCHKSLPFAKIQSIHSSITNIVHLSVTSL